MLWQRSLTPDCRVLLQPAPAVAREEQLRLRHAEIVLGEVREAPGVLLDEALLDRPVEKHDVGSQTVKHVLQRHLMI